MARGRGDSSGKRETPGWPPSPSSRPSEPIALAQAPPGLARVTRVRRVFGKPGRAPDLFPFQYMAESRYAGGD